MPVLSRIFSTSATPGSSASRTRKILAVISIKNESSSPAFHSSNTSASSSELRPPSVLRMSYASAMSCMSPYSMPLWIILT